jgi:cyclophilin family peptidyl-prolyl cis-trans isomerase
LNREVVGHWCGYLLDPVGTEKRQRQKEGRQRRLEEARAVQAAAQRRSRLIRYAIAGAVVVIAAAVILKVGPGGGKGSTTAAASSSPAPAETSAAADTPATTGPNAFRSLIPGTTPCPNADGSSPRTVAFKATMMACIDTAKSYSATVTTSQGDFTIQLDAVNAPTTVNNFVALARYHLYDGITFPRIVTGFMDQTGSPDNTTAGGPGYTFADELPPDAQYPDYSVSMANSGPDTNGSQWFVTAKGGGAQLQDKYSRFGQVTTGQDVVDKINALGSSSVGGTPTQTITITSVKVTET